MTNANPESFDTTHMSFSNPYIKEKFIDQQNNISSAHVTQQPGGNQYHEDIFTKITERNSQVTSDKNFINEHFMK